MKRVNCVNEVNERTRRVEEGRKRKGRGKKEKKTLVQDPKRVDLTKSRLREQ